MGLRVKLCALADIAPGQAKAIAVPGLAVPVLVMHVDGALFAVSSLCPHEDVSLLGGKRKGLRVICPGHGYQFDVRTGACSHDPKLRLPCYPVTVVGGDIYVDLLS